jgi:WD40 repeat protein
MNAFLEPVYAVAASPVDPTIVATGGGDDKTRVWRMTDGKEVACLNGKYLLSKITPSRCIRLGCSLLLC